MFIAVRTGVEPVTAIHPHRTIQGLKDVKELGFRRK